MDPPPADGSVEQQDSSTEDEDEEEEFERDPHVVCAEHVNNYLRSPTFQNQVLWSLISQRRQAVKQVEIVDLIVKPPSPPKQERFLESVRDESVVLSLSPTTTFADLARTYGRSVCVEIILLDPVRPSIGHSVAFADTSANRTGAIVVVCGYLLLQSLVGVRNELPLLVLDRIHSRVL